MSARSDASTYVFDPGWQKERDRLRSLEALFDPASRRYLAELGVTEGWQCLEVGCGAGGVARWMTDRVGRSGHVLATDLDPRFVDPDGPETLEVRRHDILTDPLEEEACDIAHARAVVEHVADKPRALERMIAALRPGGWLLVEDVDFGGPMTAALARYTHPAENAQLIERLYRAIEAVFAAVGADASFGPKLPGMLEDAGLEDVGGESHCVIARGATERWAQGTIEQLRAHLTATGIVSDEDVEHYLEAAPAQHSLYAPPFMTSAWGRRPAARTA